MDNEDKGINWVRLLLFIARLTPSRSLYTLPLWLMLYMIAIFVACVLLCGLIFPG